MVKDSIIQIRDQQELEQYTVIMDNLFNYGVTELTSEILNFYMIVLPTYPETLAISLFDKVVFCFN